MIQNYDIRQGHDHIKELITLTKLYIDEKMKYDKNLIESLNYKFTIFLNLYIRVEIPQQTIHTTFPIMLKFMILNYYYFNCQEIVLTVQQLFDQFQKHFEKKEHRRNMLRQ